MIVSFAAETAENEEELKNYAVDKMNRKGADMIVANNIKDAIGKDTNKITIYLYHLKTKKLKVYKQNFWKDCVLIELRKTVLLIMGDGRLVCDP